MPPQPPPLPTPTARSSGPIDEALEAGLSGDAEAGLRWAGAVVKGQLERPLPLFVTGWLLSLLEKPGLARMAFEVAAARAAAQGNVPLAVAALCEFARTGGDAGERFDSLARLYAKDSPALQGGAVVPPQLAPDADVMPLAPQLNQAQLIAQISDAIEYAQAAQEAAGPVEGPVPKQRLFSSLGADVASAMMRAFTARVVKRDEPLIEEGTTGDTAFLLARGELEVTRGTGDDRILLARLGAGALFGEMAILSQTPRAATVTAVKPSVVLELKQEALADVARTSPEVGRAFADYCHRRMVANLLRTSPILSALGEEERAALMASFEARTFEKGETLINQGSESVGLHLIASGGVRVSREDAGDRVVIAHLGVGDAVGEVAMVLRRSANADVVAEHRTVTMHLPEAEFLALVRSHPAVLAKLYELAVQRDEETSSIVAQEASEAGDLII